MTWTTKTLGEVSDEVNGIIQTGPFGTQLHESDYAATGIPVVMPKNILDGRIDVTDIAFIDEAMAAQMKRHRLISGDIVYGRRGDIGRRALVTAHEEGWLCGTGCLRVSLGEEIIDPAFLYYYLGQEDVIKWIANQAVGATMPNLNTGILRSVPVRYPSAQVQKRIAQILSAYDDLIENNTRRIQILEEMAQRLYREWFVDFRFPGHENVKMVESELGLIPEGWKAQKFSDIVEISRRAITPSATPSEVFVHFSLPAFDANRMPVLETGEKIRSGKFLISSDCLLLSKLNPRIPRLWIPSSDYTGRMIASTEFLVLIPRIQHSLPFLVQLFGSPAFKDLYAGRALGTSTSHQRVNTDDFLNQGVLLPTERLLGYFSEHVRLLLNLVLALSKKSHNLRTTRDFLLPKLISGEISVEAAEELPTQTELLESLA